MHRGNENTDETGVRQKGETMTRERKRYRKRNGEGDVPKGETEDGRRETGGQVAEGVRREGAKRLEGRRENGGRKGEETRNRDRELCEKER